jgi:hypothetical protein
LSDSISFRRAAILPVLGVIGWAYCGALIAIGRQYLSMTTTLWIHAIGAPIGFVLISYVYFRSFAFTGPFTAACWFVAIALLLDLFLVAPFLEGSFAMFMSPLGTWIPLAAIFAATYFTGLAMQSQKPALR